jgi:class 3 adenylate cyclase/TolB-like protein/Flp pilus assembly protein TadD
MKNEPKRTCAAIMFSDIVGYTALMGEDQELAFQLVKKNAKYHQEVIKIHHGKLIKELGDGVLCYFLKPGDAVAAAYELQQHYFKSKELSLRIGIHFGEVILDRHDVFGDAVNIASRLQTLGSPGSVLFSHKIREDIDENSPLKPVSLGKFKLKNVKEPLEVFALANEGLVIPKRGEMLKLLESRLKKFMFGGLILLTLALVGFGIYHQLSINKLMAEPQKSIAVLPINIKGNSPFQDSINVNLTNDLIYGLSNISSFEVIDSKSSEKFNLEKDSLKTVYDKLKVNYLISGFSNSSLDNRKITIKLFDAKNNILIWSEDFVVGSKMENVFQFNREIILQISTLLNAKLTVGELKKLYSNPTDNSDAYQAYLTGREKFLSYNKNKNEEAIKEFRKALRLSPGYKEAYQGLADAFVQNYFFSEENHWLDSSIYYSNAALKIDNTYSDAYLSLGSANYYMVDYLTAVEYFKKAISINNNNYRALANLGSTLMMLGKIDSSLIYLDKSAKINPQSSISLQNVGWNYRLLKDYSNAICWLEESNKLQPSVIAYEQMAYSYIGLNDLETAKQIAQKILLLEDSEEEKSLKTAGMIYFLCRDFEKAHYYFKEAFISGQRPINCGADPLVLYLGYLEKLVDDNDFKSQILIDGCKVLLESRIKDSVEDLEDYFYLGIYHALKGDYNQAMKSLYNAEKNNWLDNLFLTHNPVFEQFQNSPDFIKFNNILNSKVENKKVNILNINESNEKKGLVGLASCL